MKLIFIPGPWRELGTPCAKDRMPALKAERPAILRKLQAFRHKPLMSCMSSGANWAAPIASK